MSTTSDAAQSRRVVSGGKVPLLPNHGEALFYKHLPLPGVIILVHGVNSDGEWYESTERGLCEGLNERLARRPEQMVYSGPGSGRLMPAQYTPELTADGYLAPRRSADNFIDAGSYYSPVIRFRWGYKASKTELRQFGKNVWLNENDYWGGGPFANGCSTIADLWTEGLNDRLFLWLTAQHLNPVPGRDVYRCPHRAYYVHAALRLARLIKSVRDRQADCPITVICHSQGNMVGIAAAFLADRLGVQADNYLLCNPPLSLLPDNFTESWSQRGSTDSQGALGRQTYRARVETLKNFFALLRARAASAHADARIDKEMANSNPKVGPAFTAAGDRQRHGLNGSTFGRVTLYCNPHDQVISATTVQGIGWRGMSAQEIEVTNGRGVFVQRVFAHQYLVGQVPGKSYRYWDDRWNKDAGAGKDGFEFHNPEISTGNIPADVNVARGGASAGFTSLSAGMDYLEAHPDKTVWVMNMDAPDFPDYGRISENCTLLILAGPKFKTGREPLAWIARPTVRSVEEFAPAEGESRTARAWKEAIFKGGASAGFTSLSAGMDYLEAHPDKTVWVMNMDAPEFPEYGRISENCTLLILAGPKFNTGREPLAWIARPAVRRVEDFATTEGESRTASGWKSAIQSAAEQASISPYDIRYVIHDAGKGTEEAGRRIGTLAQAMTQNLPELDVLKHTFNTPQLLGDMRAGTAITNVALAIAWAHHKGKPVMVAGTTEPDKATAVVVTPPDRARVFDPEQNWFRARGEGYAYLPWWGLRKDLDWSTYMQGYSD